MMLRKKLRLLADYFGLENVAVGDKVFHNKEAAKRYIKLSGLKLNVDSPPERFLFECFAGVYHAYSGKYEYKFDRVLQWITKIADNTDYELKIGYDYSEWLSSGINPLNDNKTFGGYGQGADALFEALVEFVEWHTVTKEKELS